MAFSETHQDGAMKTIKKFTKAAALAITYSVLCFG